MKMSEAVEWAIHCVTLLADLPEDSVLPARALAEYHGISPTYLLKHLPSLAQHGILESVPGPRGGYRLARSPDEITFLHIVEAIEGDSSTFRCTEIRQRGPLGASPESCRIPCSIHVAMLQAERAWKDALQKQTIGDIVRGLSEKLSPKRRADMVNWVGEEARTLPMAPSSPKPRE